MTNPDTGQSFDLAIRADESLDQVSRGLVDERPRPALTRTLPSDDVEGEGAAIELTAVGRRYLTADLNLWSGPGEDFELIDVLPADRKVSITGESQRGWAQVLIRGEPGWVNASYLVSEPPTEPAPTSGAGPEKADASPDGTGSSSPQPSTAAGGISKAPCATGSSVEAGLTPNAISVHRAVCARFPDVAAYGGLRSDGEHAQGLALDIMVTDSALGDSIAAWVQANHAALGVSEILWYQQIWTVQRSSEGWRPLEDRGSATANHYDHVHVTVYGT